MTKQKNDDHLDYYVIEDKPKGKPKEDYGETASAVQRRKLIVVGALVALLVGSAALYLALPQRAITNTVTFTTDSTSAATVSITDANSVTTIIDGTIQAPQPTPVPSSAVELIWSPDGKTLAVMTFDSLRLYGTNDLSQPPAIIQGYEGSVYSALYSPDGKTLAVARSQSITDATTPFVATEISLFNAADLQQQTVLYGQTHYIQHLTFSPDSTLLAGADLQVVVWSVSTGGVVNTTQPDLKYVDDLAFTKQGDLLVAGSNDILLESSFQHVLEGWSLSAVESKPFVLSTYESVIYHMQLSEDGSRMVVVTGTGLEVWDTADHFIIASQMDNLATETFYLTFSKDGKRVAIGRQQTPNSSILQLWNVDEKQMLRLASGDLGLIRTLAFSPDGSQIAVGTYDGRLQLRDSTTGNLLAEIRL